jgi:hypothetical protein
MHPRRFIGISTAAVLLFISGCAQQLPARATGPSLKSLPLARTELDRRPAFTFIPSRPFHVEFGRGSGQSGLDTIVLDETGHTVLHRSQSEFYDDPRIGRVKSPYWEKAELKLPEESVQRIARSIADLRLPEMERAYHADWYDGSQWVFWLQQGGREKSVYFDNHLPIAIQSFAALLDTELQRAGLPEVRWRRISRGPERSHDTAIWNSIKN